MNALLYLISWTGWSKDDWTKFLHIFTPVNLMSKTGWTREEWADCGKGMIFGLVLITGLYLLFVSGLAV